MMEKRRIILDCDPGHDDAIAIMLLGAFPEKVELAGITTVAGNQTVDKTFLNARRVTEYLGVDVPVYRGCERPMFRSPVLADDIHGETGLDGFTFRELKRAPETEHGAAYPAGIRRARDDPGHGPHDESGHGPAAGAGDRGKDPGDRIHGRRHGPGQRNPGGGVQYVR